MAWSLNRIQAFPIQSPVYPGLFYCSNAAIAMTPLAGIVRFHCYRAGVFNLFDVPSNEASERYLELAREGWIVTHREQL